MRTTCLIVDDEPLAIKVIQTHLEQLDDVEVVATCRHALEAFTFLQKHPVDIVFLDIQMPQLTGIDLVKALDPPPRVIFTTAYRDYAVEGFELDVVDYLLKPISFPRLLRALNKYYRLRDAEAASPPEPHDAEDDAYLNIRANRQVVKLPVGDIRYIESLSDYVKIHTSNRSIVSKQRISHLEDRLIPHGFLRIHRSFLVPVAKITAFTTEEVQLGDRTLPIGRTYRQAVLAHLKYDETV